MMMATTLEQRLENLPSLKSLLRKSKRASLGIDCSLQACPSQTVSDFLADWLAEQE